MKEIKRCFCNFSYYDQQAIQEKLEEMAEKRWMLEKPGSFMWTYKRITPKRLRFSVTYFPNASDFDPGPTDGELTKIDYCRQDGWILVTSWGVMQIFYNKNVDATPIETEPVTQVENICRSMKKNVLFPQSILCGILLWSVAMRFSQWKRDPVSELSNPISVYTVLMFVGLALACLYEISFYFYWSRKARATAQNDRVFLPIKSRPAASWVLTAFSTVFLLLVCMELNGILGFAALWLCAIPLIPVIANLIKRQLKKQGVSRNVNRVISVGSVVLLTFLLLGIMTVSIIRGGPHSSDSGAVIGTYELYGRSREIYDASLPLEIEELTDVNAQWSKEANHQETVLLASTEYRQYAVPIDGNDRVDECELEYTVTDVKQNFLYDFIKQAVLNSRQDEIHDDFVFIDHYEAVDASIWDADDAYQLHWSDSVMDTYLIFWENRIVEIKFYWEPTPEQILIASEKLRNFATNPSSQACLSVDS